MLFFQYLGLKNTKIHPNLFNYNKYDQLDPNWYFIKLKPTLYLKNRLELVGLSHRRAGGWKAVWTGAGERAEGHWERA